MTRPELQPAPEAPAQNPPASMHNNSRGAWVEQQYPVATISPRYIIRCISAADPREISPEPERETLAQSTEINHELESNNRNAVGHNELRSALTDRQTLCPVLISSALDAMNIMYKRDDEGDYHLELPNDTVTIGLSLPAPSEIRIACVYNDPIPDTKWMKALLAYNEFHKNSKFGHAFFIPKDEKQAMFVYELWQDFENGMVSQEHLIRTILRAIEHSGELFTKIAQECGSSNG